MIFLRGKGIVISKNDIGEADRYITVFMEDFGKVSILVKGIRKSKKRNKIAVDLVSLTEFSFYRKGDKVIISDFNNIKDYENIRKDIDKLNIAFYILHILNQVLVENGKNRKLYNLLFKSLEAINITDDKRKNMILSLYFLYKVMKEEGIVPETSDIIDFLEKEGISTKNIRKKSSILLRELLKNNIKEIIIDTEFEIKDVIAIIKILEKYLNSNLGIKVNIDKFLWGDL